MRLVVCLFVLGQLIGCSSRSPTLLVTVENISPQALSLAVLSTHTMDSTVLASIEPLHPYDLPQPAMDKTSFLLQLPENFTGEISVNVAALQLAGGQGCLLRAGTNSRVFMPSPLDDATVVSLKDLDAADTVCMGMPRLFAAKPSLGATAGKESITLSGWGFTPGTEVYFGDTKALAVQYQSATVLQVTTPPSPTFGPVAIKVVNTDGTSATAKNIFSYANSTLAFDALPAQSIAPDTMTDFALQQLDPGANMYPDFIYTNTTGQLITVLFPQLTSTTYDLKTPLSNLSLLDINNDGKLDVALGLPMMDKLAVLVNDGLGALTAATPVAAGMTPAGIGSGDLDGDGYPEVVVANQITPATFSVLLNDKKGALGTPVSYTLPKIAAVTKPLLVGLIDLNGVYSLPRTSTHYLPGLPSRFHPRRALDCSFVTT